MAALQKRASSIILMMTFNTTTFKRLLPPLLVIVGVGMLAGYAVSTPTAIESPAVDAAHIDDVRETVAAIDEQMQSVWTERDVTPAKQADELSILRRLSLTLHGTLPSLEEIRAFEADTEPNRIDRWTEILLDDNRFVDYFAERLARAYVGVEDGQFVIFRRDRFTEWLRRQLREQRPYDEMVRAMIGGQGIWTGKGEVNFLTQALANDEFNRNKLTARTVRAFLGQRIDCAQCHDHPFDVWTQDQFEGLTAHYGQIDLSLAGVRDYPGYLFDLPVETADVIQSGNITKELRRLFQKNNHRLRPVVEVETITSDRLWILNDGREGDPDSMEAKFIVRRMPDGLRVSGSGGEYLVEDRDTLEQRVVDPSVPFHPEWLPEEGSRREQLAVWITHPENVRFERAIANRVWGLLFGKPFLTDRPVDDLPSPDLESYAEDMRVLEILGRDFRQHGCDLRRLVRVIAATQAFRMDSRTVEAGTVETETSVINTMEETWALFPIISLRPEQVIGAMLQANSVRTIDQNSHLFVRARRFISEEGFVDEFGDPGVNELAERAGTIAQALLRMNGELSEDMSKEDVFSAPARIRSYSSSPEQVVENCYLACLTRRPTAEELAVFVSQLKGGGEGDENEAAGAVQDLFWALFNSPEFSCHY